MPAFIGTDFEIVLPQGVSDESTYAFAFPARREFRPSIVIKTERLQQPTTISAYAAQQMDKIKKLLPNVAVVAEMPAQHGAFPAHVTVYDWGEGARRVRQRQHYLLLAHPDRVVTLTGTDLRDDFEQTEALFEAVFRSFKPLGAISA